MSQPKALYVSPGHSGVYLDPQTWLVGDLPRLHLKNAAQWVAHCVATASTTFTPQGSMDGETWIALESAITPSAGTIHRGDCSGFSHIRFAIGGGTGILGFSLTDRAVAEMTATISGVATEAKQDTQITSLQLIDDTVFTDDAAFTPATSKGLAVGAQADQTAPDSVDEGDFGVLRMTLDRLLKVTAEVESGFLRTSGTSATIKFASIAASAAGDNQIVTAVASNKIRVLSYVLVADAAEVVQWQDDAANNLSGTMSLSANGGICAGFNPGGWFETASGQGLDLNNVGGADVDGHLSYIEVP